MLGRGPACMARPYSRDLREGGVGGVGSGRFMYGVRFGRASGRIPAKPMGGDHNSRLRGERAWLLGRIAAVPDLTLEEIRAELADRGIPVGYGTVWRFFAAEGISFKKNRARRRARAA